MQRLVLTLLTLTALAQAGFSQEKHGYKIQLKLKDANDTMAYLAHYYGQPLPKIYKVDSARMDKNGNAVLESKDETLGGIYIVLLSDKKTYFEFLLNDGDNMTISGSVKELPTGLTFKNSPQNVDFLEYVKFLADYGQKQQGLLTELSNAKTAADTAAVREKGTKTAKELTAYRRAYTKKNPSSLLSHIFEALEIPEIPEGKHYLADGKTEDTTFAYYYYRQHYWDHFNFNDDRLIHTPVYDMRLDEYFNKIIPPVVDTVNKEADILLAKARPGKELFKYTLWWLTRWAETNKIMGIDAVFVHLVENYYMKGDAFWLSTEDLQKYIDRAHSIAPNVIGNVAPDVVLPDMTGTKQRLHDVKAKYTVLMFWDTDCGHCQSELPKIDSLYKNVLKKKGVKIFAVRTDEDEKKWKETIEKNHMQDWINVYNDHTSAFRKDYDVYSTPTIYLLDEKKIIRGKRIDHSNIASLVEMLDKRDEKKSGK